MLIIAIIIQYVAFYFFCPVYKAHKFKLAIWNVFANIKYFAKIWFWHFAVLLFFKCWEPYRLLPEDSSVPLKRIYFTVVKALYFGGNGVDKTELGCHVFLMHSGLWIPKLPVFRECFCTTNEIFTIVQLLLSASLFNHIFHCICTFNQFLKFACHWS